MVTEAARLIGVRLKSLDWSQGRLRKEMNERLRERKVPVGLICRWIEGSRTPNAERVALISELLEIDVSLWAVPRRRAA